MAAAVSSEVLEGARNLKTSFESGLAELRGCLNALREQSPVAAPAYEQQGIESLHVSLSKVLADGQYTSSVHSRAVEIMGKLRALEYRISQIYQHEYDKVAAQVQLARDFSWEERASKNRMHLLPLEFVTKDVQAMLKEADGINTAIELLARSVYRLRGDLSPMMDTLRVGTRMSEF